MPCPLCDSSDAYSEYDDGHGYCFSCQGYVASKDQGTANRDVQHTYEYLPWASLTGETCRRYEAIQKVDVDGKPISIGFRYPNGDTQVRLLDRKEFYWVKGDSDKPHGLFGRDKFDPNGKHIIITEGAKDALSIYQVLGVPAVAVVSASTATSDVAVDRSFLNSYQRVYLAFDGDAPGREAASRVARLFDYDRIWQIKFTRFKDANEYLQAGQTDELRALYWNAKQYTPESLISSLDDFERVLQEEPTRGVPYPFGTLQDKTQGIRLGESVLITAQEGVGKTEVMHAIEYSLLQNTSAPIGAIFNEELPKRHCETLAGIYLKRAVHLPDSGCSRAEVIQAFREVVKKDDRLFVYRNFGGDDPEKLMDTIRFLAVARSCRYLLLDHISLVVSGLSESDERRELDRLSTKLERAVKELNIALIVVSHVNDEGKTRGSRFISKVFDVRIDAERDVTNPNDVTSRTIKLTISKNRPTWKTGSAGEYVFDPNTNSYEEVTNANALLPPGCGTTDPQRQGSGTGSDQERAGLAVQECSF